MSSFNGDNDKKKVNEYNLYTEPLCILGTKFFRNGEISTHNGDSVMVTSPILDPLGKEKIVIGELAQVIQLYYICSFYFH